MGNMTSNSILPASAVDRRLIRGAAQYLSPQELSDSILGQLSPAECIDRVNVLLESKTSFDEVKERRLMLIRMSDHLDWLEKQRDNPKAWGAIAKQFKLVSDQIERSNITLTDVSSKLGADQAQFFVQGFVVGFDAILKKLDERLDIPEEEIIELMESGTRASEEYIDSVTQKLEIEA
ncbi:hypothetical protein SEA_TANDEM_30 [Microbacterium phage Tandem]|nr:hypothetical protein SEA_PIONEER3_30 [Microbacterium phage Pioneer3]AWY06360.1 hypothetical protein SEA_TANDEM_30 [Microbacterium phage Tandem]QAU07363.1 hypothetical protein SEA_ALLEB_31 [Microbacterium phage Alleb]